MEEGNPQVQQSDSSQRSSEQQQETMPGTVLVGFPTVGDSNAETSAGPTSSSPKTEKPETSNSLCTARTYPLTASEYKGPKSSEDKQQLSKSVPDGWLALPFCHQQPADVGDMLLPLRATNPTVYLKNTVTIKVNHFPVTIKFNQNTYFHYELKIERISKDQKQKKFGSPIEDNDRARLSKRFLQKLVKCLVVRLMKDMKEKAQVDAGIASDWATNIYATHELEPIGLVGLLDISQLFDDPDPDENDTRCFSYKLTREGDVFVGDLVQAVNNMRGQFNNTLATRMPAVFNAVIKAMPKMAYLAIGRTFVEFPTDDGKPLGMSVRAWPGITACIKPGWKMFLNLELSYATMIIGSNVIDALKDFFSGEDCSDVTLWSKKNALDASKFLKSIRVTYSPQSGKTLGGVVQGLASQSVSEYKFSMTTRDGQIRTVSVAEYFEVQYGCKLKCRNGPLLILKNEKHVPAELCTIKRGQSVNRKLDGEHTQAMLTIARKKPIALENAITGEMKKLDLLSNNVFAKFGMDPTHSMLELQGRVLDPPNVVYRNDQPEQALYPVSPENGQWSAWQQTFKFYKPYSERIKWAILGDIRQGVEKQFIGTLTSLAKKCGLNFDETPEIMATDRMSDSADQHNRNVDLYKRWFGELVDQGCLLAIVVIPRKPSRLYSQIKQAAELEKHGIGFLTQCIVYQSFCSKPGRLASIVQNILLKINSKLDGVTHVVSPPCAAASKRLGISVMKKATLILGADVSHPPPGNCATDLDGNTLIDKNGNPVQVPSFAAVTSSMDPSCMPVMLDVRAQAKAGRGALEVIQNFAEIAENMIRTFFQRNGRLPEQILYYRAGVGSGQFKELLQVELRALRSACTIFDALNRGVPYQPQITFITVQKRHKTRFFCVQSNAIQNAPPGTVVDNEIAHPPETDFYLLSHQPMQGTSRPTRYHLLWDDNNFNIDELELLTYYMCHMYVRCNRAVKMPAVTYYAHCGAVRAKAFAVGQAHLYADLDALNEAIKRNLNFIRKYPMHFV